MHTLYKLNFSNGKSYVGQTVRKMITRISQHRQNARTGSLLAVHCAWRSYGEPEVEILGAFDSAEALHEAEIDAIFTHNTLTPNGYNLCDGGETAPSKNPEVAAKISAKATGRKHTEEAKALTGQASKNSWEDAGYRERVIAAVKASWTPDRRAARSMKSKELWAKRKADGWVMPDSHKANLSRKVVTKEARENMSKAAKGKPKAPRSEATKAKLSAGTAESWKNPELKASRGAAISAALKKKFSEMPVEERDAYFANRKLKRILNKSKL